MKTLEFYFSSPDDRPDNRLPWAPTSREWYEDFRHVLKVSGYEIGKSEIRQQMKPARLARSTTIIVEGYKR